MFNNTHWDYIITPKTPWFKLNLDELWRYRHLIFQLIKKDFMVYYQQTILGPLWYLFHPLIMTLTFTIIFGRVLKLDTDQLPPFLFYFCGTIAWGYFANCFNNSAHTFTRNAHTFSLIYFPRLTVPIAATFSHLMQFAIQALLLIAFIACFSLHGLKVNFQLIALVTPLLLIQMALLGLGAGLTIAAITAKYRDLNYVLGLIIQLWMFASPVVYPLSSVDERYRGLFKLNPMTSIIEQFRLGWLGQGSIDITSVCTSWISTVVIFLIGVVLFTKTEKRFMDTI